MFIAASPVCLPHTSVPILLNTIFLYHPHLTSHHSWPFSPLFFLFLFAVFVLFIILPPPLYLFTPPVTPTVSAIFTPPTAPSPPSILFLAYALFRLPPIALATTSTTAYLLCVASAGHILASKERKGE